MPLNVDAFRSLANSAWVKSRDLVVHGEGDRAVAKLGNYVLSQGGKANDATMSAFKAALENEYGVFGPTPSTRSSARAASFTSRSARLM